jgi:hypothetical protein
VAMPAAIHSDTHGDAHNYAHGYTHKLLLWWIVHTKSVTKT